MAIIIELSSNFGEYLSTVTALPSVLFPNRATVPVIVIKQRPLFRAWKHAAKNWRSPQKMPVTYDASAAATTQWRCCRYAVAAPVSKPAGRLFFLLLSISGPCHRRYRAKLLSKVIYPKYTKHWPYTVANCDCVCNKMFNQGLNHGLFLSLFKFISCAIHRIV